jgi:hypothetical protein
MLHEERHRGGHHFIPNGTKPLRHSPNNTHFHVRKELHVANLQREVEREPAKARLW